MIINENQSIATYKCSKCKKKTEHKISGFKWSNRRFTCLECGQEDGDWKND